MAGERDIAALAARNRAGAARRKVRAGTKAPPRARDDQAARIAQASGQRIINLARHGDATRIHPLWHVQGDGGDLVAYVDGDGFVGHVFFSKSSPRT